jgi:PST family polysaccharide transporter
MGMISRIHRSTVFRNAVALYGVQFAGMCLPLLTVPYLARTLRPAGWGLVVFAQSFGAWLGIVMEYGFDLSATREVARERDDPAAVARVVSGVQGAKCLLAILVVTGALAASMLVPVFREHRIYLFWAAVAAGVQGFSPFWYFQGTERMRAPAMLEVCTRTISVAGIFLWVRFPGDGWMVLALQALTNLVCVGVATTWMYRRVPFALAGPRRAWETLRASWGLFLFRSAGAVYTLANSFVLGLLATAQAVAYFGGAEKLVRTAISLLMPVSQALYPRVSHLMRNDREGGKRLVRVGLVAVTGVGLVVAACIFVTAPLVVHVLLGPGYEPAIPILRALAPLPLIISAGTVLAVQWALPVGLDRPAYLIVMAAGVVNVTLAVAFTRAFGAIGMAYAVLVAETFVVGSLLVLSLVAGSASPWRRAPVVPPLPPATPNEA